MKFGTDIDLHVNNNSMGNGSILKFAICFHFHIMPLLLKHVTIT